MLTIEEYSEKSFVIRGSEEETKKAKEDLKKLGGKWNSGLRGGGGWIYSNKKRDAVDSWFETGEVPEIVRVETPVATNTTASSSTTSSASTKRPSASGSKDEYEALLSLISTLTKRLTKAEERIDYLERTRKDSLNEETESESEEEEVVSVMKRR